MKWLAEHFEKLAATIRRGEPVDLNGYGENLLQALKCAEHDLRLAARNDPSPKKSCDNTCTSAGCDLAAALGFRKQSDPRDARWAEIPLARDDRAPSKIYAAMFSKTPQTITGDFRNIEEGKLRARESVQRFRDLIHYFEKKGIHDGHRWVCLAEHIVFSRRMVHPPAMQELADEIIRLKNEGLPKYDLATLEANRMKTHLDAANFVGALVDLLHFEKPLPNLVGDILKGTAARLRQGKESAAERYLIYQIGIR